MDQHARRDDLDEYQNTMLGEITRQQRAYTALFHLYEVQEQTKLISDNKNQNRGFPGEILNFVRIDYK